MHLLKAAALLHTTVNSLKDFPHLCMFPCERGLEVGAIPTRGLEILVKALFKLGRHHRTIF